MKGYLIVKWIRAGGAVGVVIALALLLLAAAELALLAAGWGENRSPFIRRKANGQTWHVRNFNFYRQFSGIQPRDQFFFAIPDQKPAETCRIIVLGSSAAADWPTVGAGFSSMLWLLLAERYPGVQFEVYNCADAGVNSHIMRTVATACARYRPDVFLVYTGNNELNGPFGIPTAMRRGSVPTAKVAQWLIRLRGLRLTQLWEGRGHLPYYGMSIPEDRFPQKALCRLPGTPEVDRIVENYRANLTAICRSAAGCGARTVLCTLSVNLRDWAPEYPDHLKYLSPQELEAWNHHYEEGKKLAESAQWTAALDQLEQARLIDDTHAGLWWHVARCLLRLNRLEEARVAFQMARDRDSAYWAGTRSFLNETVRQVARQEASRGVQLADVEKALAERSQYGITGGDLIPDSCHFSFRGHWEAAQAILPVLEAALPEVIRCRRTDPVRPVCFDDMTLLINHDPRTMLTFIRGLQGMVQTPENRRLLQERIDAYEQEIRYYSPDPQHRLRVLGAYCDSLRICPCRAAFEINALPLQDPMAPGRKLLAQCPQYAVVWVKVLWRLVGLKQWDDLWVQARSGLELFPEVPELWSHYATAAEQLGRTEQAAEALQTWLHRYPWSAELWYGYGNLAWQRNQIQAATDAWLTALLMHPPQMLALAHLAELPPMQLILDIHRLPARVVIPSMMPFILACVDYLHDRFEAFGAVGEDTETPPAADPQKAKRIREAMGQLPFNAPAYWQDLARQAAAMLELEHRNISARAMRDLADLFGTFATPH